MADSGRDRRRRRRSGDGPKLAEGELKLIDDGLMQALAHPERRSMLRLLHVSDGSRTPTQLAEARKLSPPTASYHASSLAAGHAVAVDEVRPSRGACAHHYVSRVAENPAVLKILEATRELDEARDADRSK